MSRLPPYTPAQVAKILEENGFRQFRQKGSYVFYGFDSRVLTIPMHRKELAKGTPGAIIKQSGLPKNIFNKKK